MTCYFHYHHQIHQHTRCQLGPLSFGIFISGFFIVFVSGIFIIFYWWFFECWKVKCFYHFYQWFFFINEILIILSVGFWLFYEWNWCDCFYQWFLDCFASQIVLIIFISGFLIVLQVKLSWSFLSVVFWLFYVWNCFYHNFLYQWNLGYFNTNCEKIKKYYTPQNVQQKNSSNKKIHLKKNSTKTLVLYLKKKNWHGHNTWEIPLVKARYILCMAYAYMSFVSKINVMSL